MWCYCSVVPLVGDIYIVSNHNAIANTLGEVNFFCVCVIFFFMGFPKMEFPDQRHVMENVIVSYVEAHKPQ